MLCAVAAYRTREDRGGHEGLLVSRARPFAVSRWLVVGTRCRCGHDHAPEHRIPVPDGPVVLGVRSPRFARLGGATTLARDCAVRRRGGRALAVSSSRPSRNARDRRRHRVSREPLRRAVLRSHVGAPSAVGRAAVVARTGGCRAPNQWLASPGSLRAGLHLRQRHECILAGVHRDWTAAVGPLRDLGSPRDRCGTRSPCINPTRVDDHPFAAVVGGRASDPGTLRPPDSPTYRERRHGRADIHRRRSEPRAGLLVRLRPRRIVAVDQCGARLYPKPLADRGELRGAHRCPAGRVFYALASARLCHRHFRRRARGRCGDVSVSRSSIVWCGRESNDGNGGRARTTELSAFGAAHRPCVCALARGRSSGRHRMDTRERPWAHACARFCRWRCDPRRRECAAAVHRCVRLSRSSISRGAPGVCARRRRNAGPRAAHLARTRTAGLRFCCISVGSDTRPGDPRAPRSTLDRARVDGVRHAGFGRPGPRPRSSGPRGRVRGGGRCADRETARSRRCARAQ